MALDNVEKLERLVYNELHHDCPPGQYGCTDCMYGDVCPHVAIITRAFSLLVRELKRKEEKGEVL